MVTQFHIGYFGCGKSFIIAISIMLLYNTIQTAIDEQHSQADEFKILISANTNTAVDRVLLILVKMGFTEFVRVGPIAKIHKDILPYSVSANKDDNVNSTRLVAEIANTEDEAIVLKDILSSVSKRDPSKYIRDSRIVATTCHSTTLKCMQGIEFPIVFLDEASQMTEPVSLLPLKFDCKRIVAFGDPKQLPPTIETNADKFVETGLERTLFERLASPAFGLIPIKLRSQYRCNRQIAKLASELFYDNTVVNGQETPTCLNGIDPLVFINCDGEVSSEKGSSKNLREADIIVEALRILRLLNIPMSEVGVITPFRAQASLISNILSKEKAADSAFGLVQVSTIDAFQGAEKSIIFASLVKRGTISQSTFMNDVRRLNVMITRAKSHLFLVGDSIALNTEIWKKIVSKATKISLKQFKNDLNLLINH
eukprot:NODE_638_length_5124_cov_1.416119.p2 type:complete len:426 gc:universal NODE_638_length_5124_cov_1.416119:1180-2457(+)